MMCHMKGSVTFVNKILTEQNVPLQVSLHLLPKNLPSRYISLYVEQSYINTAVSFKSNITKLYYCWPPIFDPLLYSGKEHLYFGSPHNISVTHVLPCHDN